MCGFIGVHGPPGVDVAPEIYEGLLSIQHRGQDAAGITTFTDTFHVKKGVGLVRDIFDAQDMERLRGNLGVGHVRYPTIGAGSGEDAQPFHVNFPVGVAMAHNGNLTNFQALRTCHATNTGTRLNSSCDLEVLLYVFVRALSERVKPGELVTAEDVFAAVQVVFEEVKGAYSVVAVLPDVGLLAFRDPFGIKPIVFGRKETSEGTWHAVASESVVLDVAGYDDIQDLGAGEAMFIGLDGRIERRHVADKPHRPCIFELVYFARPDSMIDKISVYKTRIRFGQALARQWKESGAPTPDVIIPIPDSSRDAAMAMANEMGIPYREGLVKNRYIGRTFIMPSQGARQSSVRRKLNTIPLEFEGKDVCLVDDSIVRGNTARRIVRMAREAGANKVYLAITSPPLISPCPYGIDMATKTEFIAGDCGEDPQEVANRLEADHLVYLDREAMNDAARAGNPEVSEFCNACFNGVYPTGDITPEVLETIGGERTENRQRTLPFQG
ncbi:MAG TPA: amidophosphoribosyltransferase [Planctomycetes bacterium]|nr:amidophosphoribosyltransferase [Planctomycetota bacterium]